ncbi:MAG: ABC transporter ATP-binding protein [Ancalomicrobiaceae bacterium]|nr:ABC transporter ATP-binding protein [Ancalomicrobiaceae bacterium]
MELVTTQGLVKRFGSLTAVDGVSLRVQRGEVVGFLGPNGAGKSTTMKMITGFLQPDAGSASIAGIDVAKDPVAAKRRVGYLPEGAPAYGDMAVGAFLEFCGRIRGLRGGRLNDRLADMVDAVALADVWNRPIETLSKGFRRRVGIAQALLHDPDVLILDEPTDGLDPNQKHEMRALIRAIAPGKAIIISTHILEEVEPVCSRAVIIAAGRIVADATPQELTEPTGKPSAVFVTVGSREETVVSRLEMVVKGRVEIIERFDGSTRVVIHADGTTPDPIGLAAVLAGSGLPIEEIGLYRPKLDDIFRAVTTGGNPTLH